jgi:4-hydroxy-2-oxoheptanedioate aldolase
MDHPLITETRKRVADVCRAHGKFAGTTGTPATIDTLIDMGYRFISIGGDVAALNEYCQNMAGVFQARQG